MKHDQTSVERQAPVSPREWEDWDSVPSSELAPSDAESSESWDRAPLSGSAPASESKRVASWDATPRISHADELQLACRLAECQRELLALALHTPQSVSEVARIVAEVATGVLRVEEVVEGAKGAPNEAARADLEGWFQRVREFQRSAAAAWPSLDLARRRGKPRSAPTPRAAEALLEESRALVSSIALSQAVVDRILRVTVRSTRRSQLPPSIAASMRRLEAEADSIRDRFMTANQGLVSFVVQRYLGMGLSRADLMQEGNIGLMRAIERFDHRRGSRFGTYAIWWIRQSVRRALANQSRTIRIPVHALGTRYALDQAVRRLTLQLGRQPSEHELSKATGVVPASVNQLMGLVKEPLSLDAPRGPDNDTRLGDSVEDQEGETPMEHAVSKQRVEQLNSLLGCLNPREREMLRMRFGLDGWDECTLEEIGRAFSLTRERVRQIVTSALDKLHRQTQVRRLPLESNPE